MGAVAEAPEGDQAEASSGSKIKVGFMDVFAEQKRQSWDDLKNNLSKGQWREEGVPGSNAFDDYAAKLEKTRNERLGQQESDTKKMLKAINKGKGNKEKKAGSSSSSDAEDKLLSRYKRS